MIATKLLPAIFIASFWVAADADPARPTNAANPAYRVDIEARSQSITSGPAMPGGPAADGWTGQVEFYVDAALVTAHPIDRPMGTHTLQLVAGVHQFRFGIAMHRPLERGTRRSDAANPVIEDDCVGQFEIRGPARLQARLDFVVHHPAPGKFADALDCALVPSTP